MLHGGALCTLLATDHLTWFTTQPHALTAIQRTATVRTSGLVASDNGCRMPRRGAWSYNDALRTHRQWLLAALLAQLRRPCCDWHHDPS